MIDPNDPNQQAALKAEYGITPEGMAASGQSVLTDIESVHRAQAASRAAEASAYVAPEIPTYRPAIHLDADLQARADAARAKIRGTVWDTERLKPGKPLPSWARVLLLLMVVSAAALATLVATAGLAIALFGKEIGDAVGEATVDFMPAHHYRALDGAAAAIAAQPGLIDITEESVGPVRPWAEYTARQQRNIAAAWIELAAGESSISSLRGHEADFVLSTFLTYLDHLAAEEDEIATSDARLLRVLRTLGGMTR